MLRVNTVFADISRYEIKHFFIVIEKLLLSNPDWQSLLNQIKTHYFAYLKKYRSKLSRHSEQEPLKNQQNILARQIEITITKLENTNQKRYAALFKRILQEIEAEKHSLPLDLDDLEDIDDFSLLSETPTIDTLKRLLFTSIPQNIQIDRQGSITSLKAEEDLLWKQLETIVLAIIREIDNKTYDAILILSEYCLQLSAQRKWREAADEFELVFSSYAENDSNKERDIDQYRKFFIAYYEYKSFCLYDDENTSFRDFQEIITQLLMMLEILQQNKEKYRAEIANSQAIIVITIHNHMSYLSGNYSKLGASKMVISLQLIKNTIMNNSAWFNLIEIINPAIDHLKKLRKNLTNKKGNFLHCSALKFSDKVTFATIDELLKILKDRKALLVSPEEKAAPFLPVYLKLL